MMMTLVIVVIFVLLSISGTQALKLNAKSFQKSIQAGVLASSIAITSFASPMPVHADAVPSVGTVAPDFSLPSNRGKDLGTKDLSGKWSVVYFYPGDFTQVCASLSLCLFLCLCVLCISSTDLNTYSILLFATHTQHTRTGVHNISTRLGERFLLL